MNEDNKKYFLVFDTGLDSELRFPCDKDGNVLSKSKEIQWLVDWCWKQPKENYEVFGEVMCKPNW